MNTLLCAALWLLLPALILGAVVHHILETQEERIHRWHRNGASQSEIARRTGLTRYRVRRVLAG